VDVSREHIEIAEGAGGPKARIVGHNIRVIDVAGWFEKAGMSADEIVEQFPQISKADVFAALAYYWDNKDALDQKAADDAAFVEEMMRKDPGRFQELLKRQRMAVISWRSRLRTTRGLGQMLLQGAEDQAGRGLWVEVGRLFWHPLASQRDGRHLLHPRRVDQDRQVSSPASDLLESILGVAGVTDGILGVERLFRQQRLHNRGVHQHDIQRPPG
jgi:uncharacterized protein (DUF433 family)